MKYILTIITAFLLLLPATLPVFAQGAGSEWDTLNQEAMELYRTGKYDRGVLVARKALEVAEKNVGPNHLDVATSLNNLALLYYTQGRLYRAQTRYAQAEPLYKRALAIREKALGPDHPDVAECLNNLAEFYHTQGRYAKAEKLKQQAARIRAIQLGDKTPPKEILKIVTATYKALKTYKAEGTTILDMDAGEMTMKTETIFSILLKKPNLYLISCTVNRISMPGMAESDEQLEEAFIKGMAGSGAVWSDGTQPYLYRGTMNAYSKMTSDEIALGRALLGICGRVAVTIPSLFLSAFKEHPTPFSRMKNPKIEKTEKIGDEDCYVLSGPSATSKKETFWISKTSYLIRKHYISLEPPGGGSRVPEITDEQLEKSIKDMGQEVTEESKKNMRESIKGSPMFKLMNMKGFSTELHTNISSPELSKSDFKFALPEDSVLKDSGKPAPDFVLKDIDGNEAKLADFKGKVVLIDFWASWCGPCKRAMPHIQRIYEKYKDKDVVVLGINTRESQEGKVEPFLKEHKITYRTLVDNDGKVAKQYRVRGIPALFLIDMEGLIQFKHTGFRESLFDVLSGEIEELKGAE
jgi:peroxiredoxin/tetratricopeptide (TPR) repeat protein